MAAGAYKRVQAALLIAAAVAAAGVGVRFGRTFAVGMMLGSAVAFINFLWLKGSMLAFSGRFAQPEAPASPKSSLMMVKFLLRYAVIGVSAFVILKSSAGSAKGFVWGLLMSVPALLFEAGYEIVFSLRHDIDTPNTSTPKDPGPRP